MAVLVPQETPRTWQLQEVLLTEPSTIKRAISAAAIGNITEWYDFGVYASDSLPRHEQRSCAVVPR